MQCRVQWLCPQGYTLYLPAILLLGSRAKQAKCDGNCYFPLYWGKLHGEKWWGIASKNKFIQGLVLAVKDVRCPVQTFYRHFLCCPYAGRGVNNLHMCGIHDVNVYTSDMWCVHVDCMLYTCGMPLWCVCCISCICYPCCICMCGVGRG